MKKKEKLLCKPHFESISPSAESLKRLDDELMNVITKRAEAVQTRSVVNTEILSILTLFLKENPFIRFGQALQCLDIVRNSHLFHPDRPSEWVDEFNTESEVILKRARSACFTRGRREK